MDELYILARRVLLDALVALGKHRRAAILAGAQAIYLRVGEGTSRQGDKDALDVFRLLRGISIEESAERIQRVRTDAASRVAAEAAATCLSSQFGDLRGAGVAMIVRAIGPLADPDEVSASCIALTTDLLLAIRE